jgi:hypothetical protein
MNEILRRALFRARLSEAEIAARMAVDPKTVRRWVDGRPPYPRHRLALADLLHVKERDLWPDLAPGPDPSSQPAEIVAVYPHRWAVPREIWHRLFESARGEIDILAYSSLFLAEDSGLLDALRARAKAGVAIRIALGDPDCPRLAVRGTHEGIDEAMAAKIRNALVLYRPLQDNARAEIRLHRTALYNSIYRSDDYLLVNQHAYGLPAAHAPALYLRRTTGSDMFASYLSSFERIWRASTPRS